MHKKETPVSAVLVLIAGLVALPGCRGCQGDRGIVHEPVGANGAGLDGQDGADGRGGSGAGGGASGGGSLAADLPRPRKPVKSREWSKHAGRVESRGIFIQVRLDSHPNDAGDRFDLLEVGGCLQSQASVAVVEERERWNVYKLVETYADGDQRTYLVADPPERAADCPECTRRVSAEEISGCPREAVGITRKELSLRDYPVRVQWQIQPAPEGKSVLDWTDDQKKILLEGSSTLSSKVRESTLVAPLCDQQLRALQETDSSAFVAVMRAIPVPNKWPAGKTAEPQTLFSRMPITIERIQQQLEKLNTAGVPKVNP